MMPDLLTPAGKVDRSAWFTSDAVTSFYDDVAQHNQAEHPRILAMVNACHKLADLIDSLRADLAAKGPRTVKRYLVFLGDWYDYGSGGWEAFVGSADTVDAAKDLGAPTPTEYGWAHVVDTTTEKIVAEYVGPWSGDPRKELGQWVDVDTLEQP